MPTTDNQAHDLTDQQLDDYREEARQRWGQTAAWKQSQERTKNWTKADYARIKEDGQKFMQTLAAVVDRGAKPADPAIQHLIGQHYASINVFYDCSLAMYRQLATMYVDDSRFRKYYERFRPELAVFMRDAIFSYCDQQTV